MSGSTVAKTVQLLGISKEIVSKVMTACKKDSENSSTKHKSGRSIIFFEMDKRTLNLIVGIDHKTTAGKIRAELNGHL